MLKNYFYLLTKCFYYIECNFFIFFTTLGIIKVKNNCLSLFYIKKRYCFSYYYNRTITPFFNYIILLIHFGYRNKFKIVGVGYRQFYCDNIIVYKLRYSHLIYNILPLDIRTSKKKKNKKYFTLYSLNKNKLNSILHKWLFYRIINVYTKKGFFKKNNLKQIHFKLMIKKLI